MASRLSFLLWNSGPDTALLDVAERDELQTPQQVQAVVAEMLNDPRARCGLRGFADDWLRVYNNLKRNADGELGLSEPLLEAMREETLRFVERVLIDDQLPMIALLTDQTTEF